MIEDFKLGVVMKKWVYLDCVIVNNYIPLDLVIHNILISPFFSVKRKLSIFYYTSVQEVQAEGKYAIDSPGCATVLNLPPEDYNLGQYNN